jgi:hypothetical protein
VRNCWFHDWSKWDVYVENGMTMGSILHKLDKAVPYAETRQKRTCLVCGFRQDELVKGGA